MLYSSVLGKIPLLPADYLIKFHRPKWQIRATTYNNFVINMIQNIINWQDCNNKQAVIVPNSKTDSIVVRFAVDWNDLEDSVVCVITIEFLKSAFLIKRNNLHVCAEQTNLSHTVAKWNLWSSSYPYSKVGNTDNLQHVQPCYVPLLVNWSSLFEYWRSKCCYIPHLLIYSRANIIFLG